MGSRSATPPTEPASPLDGGVRKRVCKACDRCRLKKSKCDGAGPCSRCRADNAICVFGERKKSHDKVYPKGYVEMLETQQAQLVNGLQELYRRLQVGESWPGAPLKESKKGAPLTHEILERLGALNQDGQRTDEYFEENLELLQRKLLADGAGFARGMSFDTSSEADYSPVVDPLTHPKASHFSNPWAMNHLPPTPPTNSPRPSLGKTSSPLKSQLPTPVSQLSEETPIFMEPSELPDVMDFNMAYQTPVDFDMQAMQTFYDPTRMIINPCLTMKDGWYQQDDHMAQYFHGGTFS